MQNYLQAFFIERPLLETANNLVIISESATFRHTAMPEVAQTADILQGRFGWAPFVIGMHDTPTAESFGCLPGAVELAWESGVFLMPFETFASLPSPPALLTNLYVFDNLWELLSQDGDGGDLETLLLEFHKDEGLVLGSWALPALDDFFYLDKKSRN